MNELQPYRQQPGAPGPYQPGPSDGYPTQTIDVPGSGPKRDYAGLLEYWQMVRRHKVAVVLATFIGTLLGFLMTLSSPRVYQARTSIEIQSLNEGFLNMNMKNANAVTEGSGYPGSDIQTQVRVLQSRTLISRVTDKVAAAPRPDNLQPPDRLGLWRQALKLNPPSQEDIWKQALGTAAGSVRARGSDTNAIVDITCDSTQPKLAADFCNTLTTEYIDQNLESRWKSTEYTGQWLTTQLQDLKIKLEKQEEELQRYARATSLVVTGSGTERSDVNETRLADLQKELSSAQADRFGKQSKFETASSSPSDALPDVLDDPALKTTQSSLDDLEAKLAQLTVTFTPKAPEVRRVQVQIDALTKAVTKARTNAVTRIRKDFEGAQRREALLAKAYQEQAQLVSSKSEETAHYNLLKRDVDSTRQLYDTLQQRLKESSIAAAMRANNVRIVDTANTPGTPYQPDVSQRVLLGLLFGAVVGVTFSVMRERADRTLQDPGDATYYLGVPELGVVPIEEAAAIARVKPARMLPGGARVLVRRTAEDDAPNIETMSWFQKTSLLAESFRTTLTSILFSRRTGERPRVLVLTSASPKEGKTTVVSNLSIALAEIGHNTLVIDADMRRPRLHAVFNVGNELGLSDLLMERSPLTVERVKEACVHSQIPGLFVLPSGGSRRNVSSLLHSDRLPELLKIARDSFDTVVVDTPPMVNIADARVLGRYGDGLIVVVRSGSTTRDAALLAISRFADDGIPVLGTILNFWNPKTPGYSYYRYYYAGYQHYYGDGSGKNGGADDGEGQVNKTPSRAPSSAWARRFAFGQKARDNGDHQSESQL